MKRDIVGLYFSGIGNSKYCLETFLSKLSKESSCVALEDKKSKDMVSDADRIVLAYSIQYSNIPKMLRDYINENADLWYGKEVFLIATMGMFSGDGTGCAARVLKKHGAKVIGGLHLKMPDSISDCKALKYDDEKNKIIVRNTKKKIIEAVNQIKEGNYPKEGLGFFAHLAGLFGQRLWFFGKTKTYSNRLTIHDHCIGCGKCVSQCPMNNLFLEDGKVKTKGQCTMCYRCVNQCPKQAITLLGKKVTRQQKLENYIS